MSTFKTMDGGALICELNYISYAHNRKAMSAEQLARLFPETWAAMEKRYQQQLTNDYADHYIRRDLDERHKGRPERDWDTFGRPLKAGT